MEWNAKFQLYVKKKKDVTFPIHVYWAPKFYPQPPDEKSLLYSTGCAFPFYMWFYHSTLSSFRVLICGATSAPGRGTYRLLGLLWWPPSLWFLPKCHGSLFHNSPHNYNKHLFCVFSLLKYTKHKLFISYYVNNCNHFEHYNKNHLNPSSLRYPLFTQVRKNFLDLSVWHLDTCCSCC